MFLAALCTAVVPAGHSYFPLVVLAEGIGTIPFWILETLPAWLIPSSACRGGADGDLNHSCDQGSGCLGSGWPWAGVVCPLRMQFQLNVTALQGHFQRHYL